MIWNLVPGPASAKATGWVCQSSGLLSPRTATITARSQPAGGLDVSVVIPLAGVAAGEPPAAIYWGEGLRDLMSEIRRETEILRALDPDR